MPDSSNAVNQVSDLSKAITEYGPFAVILAVFLLLFLIIIIWVMKNNEKYFNSMIKQNNEMFQQLYTSMPKKGDYNEEDIVEIFTKMNEVFKEECKKINEKTGSGRAAIYVFHNGAVASHGLPFFKMTCVSEWIARGSGFQEQISKHTNLNLALFSSLVEELYNNGEFIINHDGCDQDQEPGNYAFISEKSKISIFNCVYDGNNKIMAFINVEFKNCLEQEAIDRAKLIIKNSCAKIQPVLEFSSYKGMQYK